MCGFAGFVDHAGCAEDPAATLAAMARVLARRGPDDERVSYDAATRTGLAFRRLSILDLSDAGAQPMRSHGGAHDGRYEIVFNGEIYNHAELRARFGGGHAFRGRSDTEALLAAVSALGMPAALGALRGMFAFALLDRHERTLWLARDRFGVKPCRYALTHGHALPDGAFTVPAGAAFLFASELGAIRAHPAMRTSIDRRALHAYMTFGCVPAPMSIHREARTLPPGHLLRLDLGTREAVVERWWSAHDLAAQGARAPLPADDRAAIDAVERAISESVRLRMVADVPVGAFLSGGIDSSVVLAAMQEHSSRPVLAFTVGTDDPDFDETPHAVAVARHLGAEHVVLRVGSDEAARLGALAAAACWDEPFADSSQIPSLLVAREAASRVKVVLSGDGGDELFGGYYRYGHAPALAARLSRVPRALRPAVARLLRAVPRGAANALGRALPGLPFDRAGDRVHKLARVVGLDTLGAIHAALARVSDDADRLVPGFAAPADALAGIDPALDPVVRMMLADIDRYLPDDILTKVDRATMACGLEAREPLLDQELAALAFRLPPSMRIRGGERKWILRRVLERRVPRALFERPKTGFSVPLLRWLRGPLRPWAEDLLDPARLSREGHLDPAAVRGLWSDTLAGRRGGEAAEIWCVLMFEAWLGAQRDR
ncbi:MAG: asparagine synthase (glutamine-hydrolyzing) [Planctomycetota bacterium]